MLLNWSSLYTRIKSFALVIASLNSQATEVRALLVRDGHAPGFCFDNILRFGVQVGALNTFGAFGIVPRAGRPLLSHILFQVQLLAAD